MAYKDKDKQREADRERQRRRRDKIKAKGVTDKGVTQGVTLTKCESHVDASYLGMIKAIHAKVKSASQARIEAGRKIATASDSDVQAIWDKRNAQGQPVMTNPVSQKAPQETSKPPSGLGLV